MILQMEAVECGAASLAMILAYFGKWVPLEKVRQTCGVSRDGSSASSIVKAARGYGLVPTAYKVEPDEVATMTPCICHWNFCHFVVLRGFRGNYAYLNDPGVGQVKVSREEFSRLFTGVAITFERGDDFVADGKRPSMASYMRQQLKGNGEALLLTMAIALVGAFVAVATPLFTQVFTDFILNGERPGWRSVLLGAMGVVALLGLIQTLMSQFYSRRIAGSLALKANIRFVRHVLRLPLDFFSQRSVGDIAIRLSLSEGITATLVNVLVPMVVNVILIIIYLCLMMLYSVKLSVIGICVALLNMLVLFRLSDFRVNQTRLLQQNVAKYEGATLSCIDNMESIKAAGAERGFFEYWSGLFTHFFNVKKKVDQENIMLSIIPSLLNAVAAALVLVLGAREILIGQLSIGMLLAFQGYMAAFMSPVAQMVGNSQTLIEMRSQIERTEDVMEYEEDATVGGSASAVSEGDGKLNGEIELRNVSFGYNPLAPPVISDFSLTVKAGKTVAFVGASGCGKSTLAKLISGLYSPWSGEIRIDGRPLESISREEFVNSVAVIDQKVVLFDDTISQNVKMWDASIEDFSMIIACNDAQIRQDIVARPEGFDTRLVKGGNNFSGGQRQRIEIATALAREPSVLIMDEATSALDPTTEEAVMRAIRQSGITLIIIAHRLSTIRDADEIVVFDKGKACQRGTHSQLMAEEGIYRKLMESS